MAQEKKRYLLATTTLIGTIIGVGIFGVPYAIAGVGVVISLAYFVVLGGIQLLQHLFYAEVAIASEEKLRLPGLVERYLGKKARHIATVSTIFGFWGGQLAYVVVGGTFLYVLLSPLFGGVEFQYQLAWAIVGSVILYFGLDAITKIDFFATIGLFVAIAVLFALGAPKIRLDHFVLFANRDFFLPYGIILFSLSGLAAVPEMEDILKGEHRRYRASIIIGSLVATALTAGIGYLIWGVTGPATTEDAVSGLRAALGGSITVVTAVFGFLAVATSYFAAGLNLRSTFIYDFRQRQLPAWLLTVGIPVGLFLIGATNFVQIISFSGAVFGGITAVTVALLYIAVTRKKLVTAKPLGVPLWVAYLSIFVLTIGALYEIASSAAGLF